MYCHFGPRRHGGTPLPNLGRLRKGGFDAISTQASLEKPFWPEGARRVVAVDGCVRVSRDFRGVQRIAGRRRLTRLWHAKEGSTAAAKPEVVSALTLPRPAHDITVSKDGRIFLMIVDAPWLVEWVNGQSRAYPDAGWNDARAPDHSHALVRPNSLRIGPDGLLWVLDTGQPGVDHGGPSSSPSTWKPTRWCAAIRSTPAL